MSTTIRLIFTAILSLCLFACTTTTTTPNEQTNMERASSLNVDLGLRYLKQGNRTRAKQKLLLAVKLHQSAVSYGALAYFYEQTGELDEAKTFYQKAININPEAGAAHNNYGAFLCRQKQFKNADKQFLLAVDDPQYLNDAGAFENAGLCALMIPNISKAKQYFQQAITRNPKMPTSLRELAQLNLNNGNITAANKYMAQYLTLNKLDPQGLAIAIRLALKQGNRKLVLKYTNELKAKFPNSDQFRQFRYLVK